MGVLHLLQELGDYAFFAFRALAAGLLAWRRPREYFNQLYQIHVGALPLGLVSGMALGVVIWLHVSELILPTLGSGNRLLLPQVLALAVILDLAPTGAGLIVAGRSGAGLAAELGSMRLTEQIDALEVLGLSPMHQLVGPRVLACMTALPLLTVTMAAVALAASYSAEFLGGNMGLHEYWNNCLKGLELKQIVPATLKTVVFGFWIGVTGCYCGMSAHGGTEGVGRAATRGVVVSIFLVVASNVVLVKAIQLLM